MFRTRIFFVLLFPAVFMGWLSANSSVAQDTIEIRPILVPGTSGYLELEQRVRTDWEAGPQGQARTDEYHWIRGVNRVLDPPYSEGNYTAQLTFDRVAFTGPVLTGEKIAYDSDRDEQVAQRDPARMLSRFLIGNSFVLLITEHGRGAGIAGLRALYKTIEAQESANPVLDVVMGDFSEDRARFTWGHFPGALFAFSTVKKGDTWSVPLREFDIYLGETQYDLKCRLDDIIVKDGRKIGKVSFSAALTKPDDARKGMLKGDLRLELQSGQFEGTADYDVTMNDFVRVTSKTQMNITATLDDIEAGTSGVFGLKRTINETRRLISLEQRATEKESRQPPGK